MTIQPLFDRILVKPIDNSKTSAGGIMLAPSAKDKPQFATVVAVGDGGIVDGKPVDIKVSVGDTVVFAQYSGNTIQLDAENYIILRQSEVLGIVIQ